MTAYTFKGPHHTAPLKLLLCTTNVAILIRFPSCFITAGSENASANNQRASSSHSCTERSSSHLLVCNGCTAALAHRHQQLLGHLVGLHPLAQHCPVQLNTLLPVANT